MELIQSEIPTLWDRRQLVQLLDKLNEVSKVTAGVPGLEEARQQATAALSEARQICFNGDALLAAGKAQEALACYERATTLCADLADAVSGIAEGRRQVEVARWEQKAREEVKRREKEERLLAWVIGVFAFVLLAWAGWYWGISLPQQRRVEQARQTEEGLKAMAARNANTMRQKEERKSQEQLAAQQAEAARKAEEKRQQEELTRKEAARKQLADATKETPWENTLGMKFVPVAGTEVLFCVWATRVQDYRAYDGLRNEDLSGYEQVIEYDDGGYRPDGSYDVDAAIAIKKSKERAKVGDLPGNAHLDGGDRGKKVKSLETCPVVNVSWEDARAFCEWLTKKERSDGKIGAGENYRLPADWEWSVAVGLNQSRSGTPKEKYEKIPDVYPWGSGFPPRGRVGNYADVTIKDWFRDWPAIEGYDDGYATTAPVGSFAPNRYGLYDLGGNVWEWCQDWYEDSEQKSRVLRGASWSSRYADDLLSSRRIARSPTYRRSDIGFRVVLVVESKPKGQQEQPARKEAAAQQPTSTLRSFPRYTYLTPVVAAPGDRAAADTAFARGTEAQSAQKLAEAGQAFQQAAQADGSFFEAHYSLGRVRYLQHDYGPALTNWEQALALKPDSADARYMFALTLNAAGYAPDAAVEAEKILAANANDIQAHLLLGNLYADPLRDKARARDHYQRVLELDSRNPNAAKIRSWLVANSP